MLVRTDPFPQFDRLAQQLFGPAAGRPSIMPMDAYRKGDRFFVHFDLPGVDAESIDLTVENNVLTVKAERAVTVADGTETLVAERPSGSFTRQLFLGDTLDTERIEADYSAGVLSLTIPVHEAGKPRKVEITRGDRVKELTTVS